MFNLFSYCIIDIGASLYRNEIILVQFSLIINVCNNPYLIEVLIQIELLVLI